MDEKQGTWSLALALVEFAYNNAVNKTTGKSPFEVVYGYSACTPDDLIPLLPNAGMSHTASTFAQHIHDLLACEIRRKIALNSDSYKH